MTENTKKPPQKLNKNEQTVADFVKYLSVLIETNEELANLSGKMRLMAFQFLNPEANFNNMFIEDVRKLTVLFQVLCVEAERTQYDLVGVRDELESLKGAYYKNKV